MSLSYRIRPQFDANYSLLGRLIYRKVNDRTYSEGLLVLSVALLLIVLVAGFYIAWAFVKPVVEADLSGRSEFIYFAVQAGTFGLLFVLTLVGRKPALSVSLNGDRLDIQQGERSLTLSIDRIDSVSQISSTLFHRHYRKYRKTEAFYGRLSDQLLLISTQGSPVILGLDMKDQATLLRALRSSATQQHTMSMVSAL